MSQNRITALEVLIRVKVANDAFQHLHCLKVALQILMGTPQYCCLSLKLESKHYTNYVKMPKFCGLDLMLDQQKNSPQLFAGLEDYYNFQCNEFSKQSN